MPKRKRRVGGNKHQSKAGEEKEGGRKGQGTTRREGPEHPQSEPRKARDTGCAQKGKRNSKLKQADQQKDRKEGTPARSGPNKTEEQSGQKKK